MMRAFTKLYGAVILGVMVVVTEVISNPTVNNIMVSQRVNTKLVDISYDVAFVGGETVDISCEVSTNAGVSYDVPVSSFSGDYGANISIGTDRHIVWNAGVDWNENYSEQMMIRISAAAPRFQVVDDDGLLIMDNQTGLLWNQYNCTLSPAFDWVIQLEHNDYPFVVDSVATNYSGWRLPTFDEFLELADAPTVSGLTYGHPFTISSMPYWTPEVYLTQSSDYYGTVTYMWGFSFYSDGGGWSTGGSYMHTSFIPISQYDPGKLLLVKEP